ncbi:MAG: Dyp-type peroxidase [Gordonia sp. (in: high G+C Gram-positive bacteria)]
MLTGTAGLAGLGFGAAVVGIAATSDDAPPDPGAQTVEFYGEHQAGVATAAQAHANFIGLDFVDGPDADVLAGALRLWTQDAARLTAGSAGLADTEPELAVAPSNLTVTVGLGEGTFTAPGLASLRPEWLKPLPAFSIDRLEDRWRPTDVLLQICADDPTTLAHATRVLTSEVRTLLRQVWVQRGFHHRRNLFGQVDGTVQPAGSRHDDLLWHDGRGQQWMAGGTSVVLRRIALDMDEWEALDRPGRELVVGRKLSNGAPLTGTQEHDEPDFDAAIGGLPVIPSSSHIARAHQRSDREQFLRRGYNYDEGTGETGLIFAAYQRDPVAQFLPVQQRLAEHDDLNVWTTPIGSAVYAVLPGATRDAPLGMSLLGTRMG